MKSYRFLLEPLSPWCTPWQADTIFGSLCWELLKLEGEASLKHFLERFCADDPPFVLSDALPEGWFPRPLFTRLHQLPSLNFKPRTPDWLSEEHFRALLAQPGVTLPQPSWPEPIISTRELHAAIDRLSGTTGEGGNLFEIAEWALHPSEAPASQRLALYLRTEDDLDLFAALLRSLATSGFGKRKSIGRGAFRIVGEPERCKWMDDVPAANGFVSLSHFVPRPGDPTDGAWRLLTKYPKYGAHAPAPGPFKGRLTMLQPGSTFRVTGAVRPFYGRMLRELQKGYSDPVQYALAFPVPVHLPADVNLNGPCIDMKPIFLSYRRTWQTEVAKLADHLRLRGLQVFLDYSDPAQLSGPAFADELRRVIRDESAAALIHVAGDIASSAAIWNVEVPTILDRADADSNFLVVPFFRDIEPAAMNSIAPYGRRLVACNGIRAVPPPGADSVSFLRKTYDQTAKLFLERMLRGKTGTVTLSVQTHDVPPSTSDADLMLDWRSAYENDVPSTESCADILQALKDLSLTLGKTSVRRLVIQPRAHLSSGIALGVVFNRASGFELDVQQGDSVWSSSGPGENFDLAITMQQLDPAIQDIYLIVAIARPEVVRSAEKAYAKLGIGCGGRIVIKPVEGSSRESVPSGAAARMIAKRVATMLMQARADWGTGTTHLFIAAPIALAVLIGYELNALGPIVVYEHDGRTDEYNKAFAV